MTKKADHLETPWQRQVMKALGSRPDIMLWRQCAGKYHPPYHPKEFVQVAPDGIGDIMGLQIRRFDKPNARIIETVNPNAFNPHDREIQFFYAQPFAIETKSDTGKQLDSQRDFEDAFKTMGGVYIIAPAPHWETIWREFGTDPDPLCADEGQRRWRELKAIRDAETAARPVRNARRRTGR